MFGEHISYLDSIRSHYATYHNHKEVSAWAGLLLLVITTGLISRIELSQESSLFPKSILTLFILTISVLIYRYISAQLAMKDLGGSYVLAAMWFHNQLLNENFSQNEVDDLFGIKGTFEQQAQSKLILPKGFLERAERLGQRARGFQDTTRSMIYGLLVSFVALSLASVWMDGPL